MKIRKQFGLKRCENEPKNKPKFAKWPQKEISLEFINWKYEKVEKS